MVEEKKYAHNFSDLNIWLKLGVAGGWLVIIISIISFITGFLAGFA